MSSLYGIMDISIVLRFSVREAGEIRLEWNYDRNKLAIKLYNLTKGKTHHENFVTKPTALYRNLHTNTNVVHTTIY